MRLRATSHWREIIVPAALVAIGGLLATWILTSRVRDNEAAQSGDQAEVRIAEASTSLQGLMHRCELSLHTLAGMVNSHEGTVSDGAFKAFAESMSLDRHLRGARAVFYLPPRDGPSAGATLVSPQSLQGVVEAGWAPTVGRAVAALERSRDKNCNEIVPIAGPASEQWLSIVVPVFPGDPEDLSAGEEHRGWVGIVLDPAKSIERMTGGGSPVNVKFFAGSSTRVGVGPELWSSPRVEGAERAWTEPTMRVITSHHAQFPVEISVGLSGSAPRWSYPLVVAAAGSTVSLLLGCLIALAMSTRARALGLAKHMAVARDEAQQALNENRERFELAVRGTADGIWDWRVEHSEASTRPIVTDMYFSARFMALLEHPAEEVHTVPDAFWALIHPEDVERVQDAVDKHLHAETKLDVECRMLGRIGDYRWFRLRGSAQRDAQGFPARVSGSLTDITSQRATERQVRLLQSVVVKARDAIALIDARADQGLDGPIVFVNEAFGRHMGLSKHEVAGRTISAIFGPQTDPATLTTFRAAMVDDHATGGELQLYASDSQPFWADVNIFPVSSEAQSVTHWVVVIRDVSERKASEEALRQRNDQVVTAKAAIEEQAAELEAKNAQLEAARDDAQRASRAKSEFLARMSHEIRTPLNGVMGAAELLLRTELSDNQRQFAEICRSSASGLVELVSDILDFSKIEAGRMDVERVPFTPRETVQDVINTLRPAASAKGLRVEFTIDDAMPVHLLGDPTRIRQLLINLVGNAVKFTASGSVSVTVKREVDQSGTALARFNVTDTGLGISADRMDRLFKSFSQVDTSTTRQYGGSGLGLAICKRLAELMGGDIGVNSEVGAGSTFWFTVPLVELPAESAPPKSSIPHAPAAGGIRRGQRVLVAEDNKVNQLITRELLKQEGLDVCIVEDGMAAVEAWRSGSFDLILMDWHMPRMDGLEASQRIREAEQQSGRPRTPIIALTANAITGDREQCLAAGMDGYVSKPINSAALNAAVEQAMAGAPFAIRAAHTPAPETSPMPSTNDPARPIDLDAALERCMGHEAVLNEVLDEFRKQLSSDIEVISTHVRAGPGADVPLATRAAHTLKGSAGNVAAARLQSLAGQIEEAGRRSTLAAAEPLLPELSAEAERCLQQINQHLSTAPRASS